ncbi:TRAP transporter substrate-binding protein DctP [Salisediminibacterium selenitireducens]|uniref:TRAP dicarboxylate transporter, DctP subunit n=1 Tax=Bacillus selenitireducens (strain ATCC 700615 / DSM 15326 / MLS10) TaxID=439292 RepID=D6Y196_BACIE|nr:TRAP transporter substrate-binding protein DctP [Salisediminibacterium selenitireducens]ADH98700.1 TRAP dicarboxylate transporter, DctP subunit [[Bacillus] selenitireducens MLS10]
MLKKAGLLTTALSLGVVLAACGGDDNNNSAGENVDPDDVSADDLEPQEWRMVTEETEGQVQMVYAEEFADTLNELSDGQITLDVYGFGELGSEVDQVEQLSTNIIEFAVISPGFTGTLVPEGNLFALQFLFPDDLRLAQDILDESEAINSTLRDKYEEHSITPLAFWTEGAMQWTGNSPLRTPEDFDGFQMRTQESPLILRSYEAYDANPTAMSWGELYTGLQQGQVEGQENPLFFIEDANFHEVQDHLTISNHNMYVTMTTVNTEFYNGLDDATRAIVDEAVEQMRDRAFEIQEEQNEGALDRIEEATDTPTEVYELTEEEREMFRERAIPVRDFYRENEGDDAAEILDTLLDEMEEMME